MGNLVMAGNSITGTDVNINNAELQQLSAIGAATISGTQWGYLGVLDQNLRTTDSPTFGGITVNGNILITGNVDGVKISTFKTDYDAKINQNLKITASPTFARATFNQADSLSNAVKIIGGTSHQISLYNQADSYNIIESDIQLEIRTTSNNHIRFGTNSSYRWKITGTGDILPETGNIYDIGTATFDVKYIYYCNMSDTSCADFSQMSADELYQVFAQIKPRTDNIRHKTKDADFKHIDFTTLPDCFATKADKDFVKENVWMKKGKKLVKTTFDYKKGDNAGIEMTNYIHALRSLTVKSYEKIKELENEIQILKSS